jgi:hypothetical protein
MCRALTVEQTPTDEEMAAAVSAAAAAALTNNPAAAACQQVNKHRHFIERKAMSPQIIWLVIDCPWFMPKGWQKHG